jgi:hypothetical protein
MANTWAMHSLVDFKPLQRRANVVIGGVLRQCDGSEDVVGVCLRLAGGGHEAGLGAPGSLGPGGRLSRGCHSDASCPISNLVSNDTLQ